MGLFSNKKKAKLDRIFKIRQDWCNRDYFDMSEPADWADVVEYLKKYNRDYNCVYLPVSKADFAHLDFDEINEINPNRTQELHNYIEQGYMYALAYLTSDNTIKVEYRLDLGFSADDDGYGEESSVELCAVFDLNGKIIEPFNVKYGRWKNDYYISLLNDKHYK